MTWLINASAALLLGVACVGAIGTVAGVMLIVYDSTRAVQTAIGV